jgi:hypothetical protein
VDHGEPTSSSPQAASTGRVTIREAAFAPWRHMLRPQQAGEVLARSGWSGRLAAILLGTFALVLVIVIGRAGANLVVIATVNADGSPFIPGSGGPSYSELLVVPADKLLEQAWQRAPLATPLATLLVSSLAWAGSLPLLAWLQAPLVHEGGKIWPAFGRAMGAVIACVGLLAVLLLMVVLVHAGLDTWEDFEIADRVANAPIVGLWTTLTSFACFLLLAHWIDRATRGARFGEEVRPRWHHCEGCGYSLAYASLDGICPECGLAVIESREFGRRRREPAWEVRPTFANWVRTSFAVCLQPRRFYGALPTTTDDRLAQRFAALHLCAAGLLATLWLIACFAADVSQLNAAEVGGVATAMLTFTPLLGWAVHRGFMLVMTTLWLILGSFPHWRVVRKLIHYEIVYLAIIWAWNGLMFTSLMAIGEWVGNLLGFLGIGWFWPMPPEAATVIAGNVVLIGFWRWRLRQIREVMQYAAH